MIVFEKVTYKNFLSAGNVPIEIWLNARHMTLINGKNGAGKTMSMEAITYGLFGVPYRNINKPQLINSINQKQMEVTIEFTTNSKTYKVVRGMRPGIFEIYENGELINQDPSIKDYQKVLEQQILKMNYRAFTQVVVMGSSSYIPFMKLSAGARREFIEDLLDIRVFGIMQRTLKDKQRTLADDLKTITLELKSLKEKIVLQDSFVKKQLKERSESVELVREEISSYQSANEKIVAKITKLQAKIEELKSKANKYSNVDEQLADLRRIKKNMADSLKKVEKESTFYSEISECPTCKQNVGSDHKDHILVAIKEQEESIVQSLTSIEEDVKRVESRYNEWTEYENEISAINSEVSAENRTVSINQELIKQKLRYIEKLNSDTDSIDEERLKLKQLAKDAVTTSDQKDKLSVTKQYYDVVQMLLQDSGIKSKIINQYIPVINKLINKYLTDLDFFANFNLDENFNEVIKSRYRDNFSYESFSEGQKLRLDLAIMFTWREVAKLKNSVNCNLLFMDELLDGSADNVGLDMALHLLRTFKDTNIFVISHREEVGDKFDATITMDLRNNFTYIKE